MRAARRCAGHLGPEARRPASPTRNSSGWRSAVDPTTFQIQQLVAVDRQGGRSTFTFSNLKENRGLSDKISSSAFRRGVDVVTNGAANPLDRLARQPAGRPRCAACLLAGACATRRRAERRPHRREQQDYDLAVAEYTKAAARAARRPRRRASASSAPSCAPRRITSRRPAGISSTGKLEEALVEFQLAAELNPGNADIQDELQDTAHASCAPRSRSAKTARRARDADRSRASPRRCPAPTCPTDVKLPDSLIFRDASARDIFPRSASSRTSAWSSTRRSAISRSRSTCAGQTLDRGARPRCRSTHAQLLARHRAAHGHHRPRHRRQAARVRGGDRPHVLPEQRRPQGNDRHAAHRRRRAPHLRRSPRPTRSRSRTRPSGSPPPARSSRAIDKARPEVVIDVELLEVESHAPAGVRPADRVARARPGIDGTVDINQPKRHHAARPVAT